MKPSSLFLTRLLALHELALAQLREARERSKT
jgi:hypothetical protein